MSENAAYLLMAVWRYLARDAKLEKKFSIILFYAAASRALRILPVVLADVTIGSR